MPTSPYDAIFCAENATILHGLYGFKKSAQAYALILRKLQISLESVRELNAAFPRIKSHLVAMSLPVNFSVMDEFSPSQASNKPSLENRHRLGFQTADGNNIDSIVSLIRKVGFAHDNHFKSRGVHLLSIYLSL